MLNFRKEAAYGIKKKKLRWMRLDNAAKIYPAARRNNWSNVFRLSFTLKEEVDPAVLQRALVLLGGMLIFLAIVRPARETMQRKFFI